MDWVIARAMDIPVEVEVVTVEELEWLPVGADESVYQREYRDVLGRAKDYLSHRTGIPTVATRLLAGDPAEEIADAAVLAGSLVIGSARRSDDRGALHGTLALRIAARTAARLTVVPSGWVPRPGGIVVGISEDDSSGVALVAATDEAVRTSRTLVLVHAWSLPAPFSIVEGMLKAEYPTLEALHRGVLEQAIAKVNASAVVPEIRTELKFGQPAAVLADIARDEALLVVGTHRYGRIRQLFLGSVGHDVLLSAAAPVMVVPNFAPPGDGPKDSLTQ
jgi:nucleotide-binding universal stress UspA family protein